MGDPLELATNLNNSLGFTFESATTAAKFIITGTLDKFPKLEIVLPHSGGCFPYTREESSVGLHCEEVQDCSDHSGNTFVDFITTRSHTIRNVAFSGSLVGADRVVIGTDIYAPDGRGGPERVCGGTESPRR